MMTIKLNNTGLEFPEFIGQPTTTDNSFGYFRYKDTAIGKTIKQLSTDVRCPSVTKRDGVTVKSRLSATKLGFVTVLFHFKCDSKRFLDDSSGQQLFINRYYLTLSGV